MTIVPQLCGPQCLIEGAQYNVFDPSTVTFDQRVAEREVKEQAPWESRQTPSNEQHYHHFTLAVSRREIEDETDYQPFDYRLKGLSDDQMKRCSEKGLPPAGRKKYFDEIEERRLTDFPDGL